VGRSESTATAIPHLDLLALTPRLLKALDPGKRPGNVLMDITRNLA
jgi:hypothetical protein